MAKKTEVKCKVVNNGYVVFKSVEKDAEGNEKVVHHSYKDGQIFMCPLKKALEYAQIQPFPLVEILDEDEDEIPPEVEEDAEESPEKITTKVTGKDGINRKS